MADHQVRLLLIQANPPGTMVLDTDLEERKLYEALRRGQQREHFAHPVRLPAARISDLLSELRAQQPHILHFMGHGDGAGGLLLNAPDDQQEMILTAADLAALLAVYQAEAATPLHLVVLAGCHTAGAAALLVAQVPCVVAVAGAIEDTAVRDILTPEFYAALSDGRSIANAVVSAQSVMGAHGFPVAAALVHAYARPGLDPATIRPIDWLQRHPPLTPLHLDYLRHWFGQPWTTVALADLQSARHDHAHLLDLYVPLQVDCTLVIKTDDGRIVDWWVKQGAAGEEETGQPSGKLAASRKEHDDDPLFRQSHQVRRWAELGVEAAELTRMVEHIQQTLDQRWAAEQASSATAASSRTAETVDWPLEAQHAASLQPRFVLLGDPGSGKSSFLRYLTLCLAGELRQRVGSTGVPANANLAAVGDWLLDAYTPLYIEMRSLVRDAFSELPADPQQTAPRPTADTFWDYVREHLLLHDLTAFARDLRTLADEGQLLLLLDGLDEVPQADDPRRRAQVKALIEALVKDTPHLRLIVGSRPYAYQAGDWALAGFGHTTLRPLSMARLEALARALFAAANLTPPQPSPNWGGSHDLGDEESVPPPNWGRLGGGDSADAAATFVNALINHPHLDERLHANPLFFTLLAALWLADTQRRLPATQAELYRAAVDLLLDRWTRRRAPHPSVAEQLGLTPAELRPLLESLACTVHEQGGAGQDSTRFPVETLLGLLYRGRYRVVPQDISDYLTQQAGLLVSPAPALFYFSHRSFQEHLAACELTCRKADERRPPLAPDRTFPDGLIRRVLEAPALWRNVAYLAADELITQGHEGQTLLWELLDAFCQPYVTAQRAPEAAVIALGIARHHDLFDLHKTDRRYRRDLEPLRQVALQVLTDVANFTPAERNIAGELLGRHPEHDTRKGIGRRSDGLPDIDWVQIPETDGQGRWEFIYQENEQRIEPTFWIARYPITFGQFQAFLEAKDGFHNSVWWEGLAASEAERTAPGKQRFSYWNHPRENVSWVEAMAFCRWLTAQAQAHPDLLPQALQGQSGWCITLPTEWQWEKAARGHDGRQYPWGDEYKVGHANINERSGNAGSYYLEKTSAVGMYPHGVSPYGVLDMSGNVWECCLNEYGNPSRIQAEGDANCVVRGGSWHYDSSLASALDRDNRWHLRDDYDGFRVVVVFVVPVA